MLVTKVVGQMCYNLQAVASLRVGGVELDLLSEQMEKILEESLEVRMNFCGDLGQKLVDTKHKDHTFHNPKDFLR